MDKTELYNKLVCALTHSLYTCQVCHKCEGKDEAEIRMNLISELAKYMEMPLPWYEDNGTEDNGYEFEKAWTPVWKYKLEKVEI